jgi:DNA repair exonuclease SbcCD ATPase subunit
MHTYRIRESGRNRKNNEETIVAIAALALLVACGLAGVSAPSRVTSAEASLGSHRERLHTAQIENLQTRDTKLEDEIRKLSKALESARADLASFRQLHDPLIAQVATTTSRVQELEGRLQDSRTQAGRLKEYAALHEQLQKERDEAVSQAKDAAERIRELTLKLQRAGVYP